MDWLHVQLGIVVVVCCTETTYGAERYEILKRDGSRVPAANLRELDQDRVRFQIDQTEQDLPRTSIVGFRALLEPGPRTRETASATLRLVNGDILTGELASLDDSGLEWVLWPEDRAAAARLKIPLEYVLGIAFGFNRDDSMRTLVRQVPQSGTDKIRLSNGDELTGDLSELSLEQLTLETETGASTIPLKTVRAILFNEELTETPAPSPERTLIMLDPGTTITLTRFQMTSGSMIRGNLVFGDLLELSLDKLRSAVLLDSTAQPLSEREPATVEYQPFLSSIPPFRKNAGVRGGPLSIGHVSYLTGLGMQSRTELTWKLRPTDEVFLSEIGLDPQAGPRGNVRFRILLDDVPVFESPDLTGTDPPRLVRLELHQKQSLTLIADFGRDADVLDLAVWGNTLILSQPAAP